MTTHSSTIMGELLTGKRNKVTNMAKITLINEVLNVQLIAQPYFSPVFFFMCFCNQSKCLHIYYSLPNFLILLTALDRV